MLALELGLLPIVKPGFLSNSSAIDKDAMYG